MFTLKQIEPPVQFMPEGIVEPAIAVRILLPLGPLGGFICPERNRIGTKLLTALLQARMELAGPRVTFAAGAFDFNRSYHLFAVSELAPALEAAKAELEKLLLLDGSQIAWHDPREEVWRPWYSQSGRFEPPSAEEWVAETKFCDALLEGAEKLQPPKDGTASE